MQMRGLPAAMLLALLAPCVHAAAAPECGSLRLPTSVKGEILQQKMQPAGGFQPEGASRMENLPAFCRVVAVLKPTVQSQIRVEVWLPQNWNGKLMGVGNGGFSGSIAYAALADGLQRGYATASTDTGHEGSSGRFALEQPQKVIDFGYRAVHEMTLVAKRFVQDYYRNAAQHAYWVGCSAGGRQGLQSAQRYPEDYDGIVAGAPALDWTGRASSALRVAQAVRATPAARVDTRAMTLLHQAALAACDASDGLVDGVIESPQRCRFDPQVTRCTDSASGTSSADSSCLAPAQAEAARAIYEAPANSATGRAITGLYPGSELGWATWAGNQPFATAIDHFRYVVYADPAWSLQQFRFDRDAPRAEKQDDNTINALNPDLARFFQRGGKLLQYHGWSDPQISPGVSPQYYESVAARIGDMARVNASYRLFMVPGMAHCSGGDGASRFDMVPALENWVERGVAPGEIIAQRERGGAVDRTRRLCAWPRVARYDGSGDPNAAASFRCENP
ncbi:MAG TPA: tannase/feruloyl esterase family alpha/beta hydrolase [Steroidobacteraceae bacterium]|nr:tannase/feruloyl esterase family alpha/beta hydrolase [Steroidobacteraceae bacterium]